MPKLNRLDMWTEQLDLPGYEVVNEQQDRPTDPVVLTLLSTARVTLCPHCGRPSESVHVNRNSAPYRDLSHGKFNIHLIIHARQFHCGHCNRYFTPTCPYLVEGIHATERFLEQAARLIRFSDIANVADFLDVPEKTLSRWYYAYIGRPTQQPPTPLQPIKSIGIDELSLKKSTVSS